MSRAAKRVAMQFSDDVCEDFTHSDMKSEALNSNLGGEMIGVMGCFRYWCQGSKHKAVALITSVIQNIGIEADIAAKLHSSEKNTDAYIIDRLRDAIQVTMPCFIVL